MDHKHNKMIAFLFFFILLIGMMTGCVQEGQKLEKEESLKTEIQLDQPSILPDWNDGEYHDYYGTTELLKDFNDKFPDLVDVFSIGKSVLGKDIWCIRITNVNNTEIKPSCLIDGCIHGSEWESGEACLYLADYLLVNFGKNSTISNILNNTEVYIVPLVNPDGRQKNERWNDNGVDLNRNFDIYFGKIRGRCLRFGKIFGRIKIPYIRFPRLKTWFSNCGRRAFSEPETQAMRDLMESINSRDFSFYVNCHTAVHSVGASWFTFKPPFEMTQQEKIVIGHILNWVEDNTEYETFRGELKSGGIINDWCFKEFRIPSFGFEILSLDYEPFLGQGPHDHLVHWMKTTLPFFMYLLVNIDNLRYWETPFIQPQLPEGVPPDPLK